MYTHKFPKKYKFNFQIAMLLNLIKLTLIWHKNYFLKFVKNIKLFLTFPVNKYLYWYYLEKKCKTLFFLSAL